ncbi:unnamed protein product [Caenorhabditis bovis]|uniref:Ribonuclease P protein subunit p29 n=1 Tax=Caenorhabditis bovis TaxID=2654633 RepID=A0A8S1EYQ0_9PELO|nr:unnamed protein product [Caenorhabditis bovis]
MKNESIRIGDGGQQDGERNRMGVVFLDKNVKAKRNPRRTEKINMIRGRLDENDKKSFKFEQIVPLHTEWEKYFRERLGPKSDLKKLDKSILKADYHGALFTVWMAENATQIGISGIVLLETRHTFQMVTTADKFVVIPKKGSAFRFILDDRIFTLFGDGMRTRPAWRGKKPRVKRVLPMFIRGTLAPVPDGGEQLAL